MTAQQLKSSILQMAVEGKLVPQDAKDEPASVLLEKIRAEKKRLVKEGKIRQEKPLPPINEDEVPFDLPKGWEWGRLGEIFNLQSGKFISASEIFSDQFPNSYPCFGGNDLRGYVEKYNRDGDYPIIGRQGALCGNLNFARGKFYATEHAVVVETFANTDPIWAFYFLESANLNQYATATAQPGLAVGKINEVLLPLPPLSEQKRIVAKIEELIPFVEAYDKAEQKLSALNVNFPELLKKAVLQDAVQGKLVPQDPKDESASVLLERIRAEKKRLVKEGKIRQDKPLPPINEDEVPFDLPKEWVWVRLGEICSYIQRGKSPNYSLIKKYPVIAQKCIQWEGFSIEKAQFIDPKSIKSYSDDRFLQENDLLWNSTGLGTLGRIAIYYKNLNPYELAVADSHVTVIRHINNLTNALYLCYYFSNPTVQSIIEDLSDGSTKQKELSTSTITNYLVPFPPLAEQKRIVAKIDELLQWTNMLEGYK
ncbi:type I restriction endonuclease subunit S [Spirochaetia bacterium]|nr:type I restriction endonuclease subunit S [Spirochaetia bacterium]